MYQTYEAILNGDTIEWQGERPSAISQNGKARIHVTFLEEKRTLPTQEQRQQMIEAMESLAQAGGIKSIPDPLAWEREMREDRPLPGRED